MGSDLNTGRKAAVRAKALRWDLACCVQGIRRSVRLEWSCRGLGTRRGGERDRAGAFGLLQSRRPCFERNRKPRQGFRPGRDVIWLEFVKDRFDCCVENSWPQSELGDLSGFFCSNPCERWWWFRPRCWQRWKCSLETECAHEISERKVRIKDDSKDFSLRNWEDWIVGQRLSWGRFWCSRFEGGRSGIWFKTC